MQIFLDNWWRFNKIINHITEYPKTWAIQTALEKGINLLNTGDFCGSAHNELLVDKAPTARSVI